MDKKEYSYFYIFRWIYSRLERKRKNEFWILFAGMLLAAFLEIIALGSLAFFASVVADPEVVLASKYVSSLKQIIDTDFLNTSKGIIIASGFLMTVLIGLKNSIRMIITFWTTRFGVDIEAYFGGILLKGFLNVPYKWHLTRNTADLVNAVNWRVYLGRNFFRPCLNIFNNILMVVIMLIVLFIVQPFVSMIVVFVIGGFAISLYRVIRTKIDLVSSVARDLYLEINKETTMAIHGIKDVKIYKKEHLFVSKFNNKAVPLSKITGLVDFYSALPVLILETLGFGLLYVSICIMLIWLDTSTAYITGIMALLAVSAWKALPALNQVLSNFTVVRSSLPYIYNQVEYFDFIESDRMMQKEDSTQLEKCFDFRKSIRFENIYFSYQKDTPEIIKNFNFTIKKGETIGVIGTSGAGKSTLVDLLIGLLEPVRGEIFIDDKALIRDLLPSWLQIIGYVSQSPYIYDGTLAENIAFGLDTVNIDRKRVRKCCTLAFMDEFLHDLPDNIDSFIGERGVKLSGGQQQRVAIARALYNKPEVMIFDEATSSLDSTSEKLIQNTIYSFKGKQTLVIIAHRLTTVENCDTIIWLEKGEIKMIGNPEEVLSLYKHNSINIEKRLLDE